MCGNADDILAKKKRIEYKIISLEITIWHQRLILILGHPGSGKSTLVHKVIKDWARDRVLQEAYLVFVIALRSINFVMTATCQMYFALIFLKPNF